MLKVHHLNNSRSQRILWLMEELGLDYEIVPYQRLRFLGPTLKPETTAYIVHGEVDQSEGFASRLLTAGMGHTVVPAMETSVLTIS